MSNFVHLHVHTEYSLLDGACRISKLIEHVKNSGQKAIAITDHGVMFGAVDFYKECKKQNIKPIIGCEVYVARRTRHDKQHGIDISPYHLILLCKNEIGYKNLIKIVSKGYTEGFYNRPRIDRELLEAHHDGLICLSACLAGEVPRAFEENDYQKAKKVAEYYRDLFGKDNYYLEIQNHGIEQQQRILPMLKKLSCETGIPLVATNDCHYISKKDSKMQNVVVCIATNQTVNDQKNMEFATNEFYVKSEEEMQSLFSDFAGAIENTKKIADMCNFEFVFGETKLPHFKNPTEKDNETYFKDMCYDGLYQFYGSNPENHVITRLKYELDIIISMGYVDYYLIVHDFIMYAKGKDIPVGPGRGSGAGSLAAYCIGITGIDPIKYDLIFERFLNPERISMPDFDIDFCYVRRGEVIDYVIDKYGSDHVAQIVTFGTMAARGSLRDVGRALGISYSVVDKIAKAVPFDLGITLDLALKSSTEFKKIYEENQTNKELIDMARNVEGMARHASTHAAGVVITRDPADEYVPLSKNDDAIVTQYPMNHLESLGLLKMDFLGLRNLTVIKDVETMLSDIDFSIQDIPLDDKKVFSLFSKGQTNGVFQFESNGMKNVLLHLKPEHMEDLIAVISLYRPGPMDSIPRYIESRHNSNKITYMHPMLKSILDVTYGCIVYQEQVMQIFRELAGYSYGRADLVRRAMSKKKHSVMEKERQNFIYGAKKDDGTVECDGAVKNGVDEKTANAIFDDMSDFASYAFNKSHAAAYALISYQTAYLKVHHSKQYMAALMTSILENTKKVTDYITEAKYMGIDVLSPSINESYANFIVVDDNIRFGLLAIKNIGRGFIENLVKERTENGEFKDFYDFLDRMYGKDINKRVIEGLIKSGALDEFNHTRKQMYTGYEKIFENIEREHKNNISGQMDLFGMSPESNTPKTYILPDIVDFSLMQKLQMEKESCGLYLSGHPLSQYDGQIQKLKLNTISQFLDHKFKDGDLVKVVAIVNHRRTQMTRKNETMAFITIEDKTDLIECIVFPKIFDQSSGIITEGSIIYLTGRIKSASDEDTQIICEKITSVDEVIKNLSKNQRSKYGLYLKFETKNIEILTEISKILRQNTGDCPVYYYFNDTKKYLKAPQDLWVIPDKSLLSNLETIVKNTDIVLIND